MVSNDLCRWSCGTSGKLHRGHGLFNRSAQIQALKSQAGSTRHQRLVARANTCQHASPGSPNKLESVQKREKYIHSFYIGRDCLDAVLSEALL